MGLIASVALFSLFLVFKVFPKEYLNWLLAIYFCVLGTWAMFEVGGSFANLKFDSKKTVWAPCKKSGGFLRGQISGEVDAKGKIAVDCDSGETVTVKKELLEQVNPPKFEQASDMANMTFLN